MFNMRVGWCSMTQQSRQGVGRVVGGGLQQEVQPRGQQQWKVEGRLGGREAGWQQG